MLGDVIVDLDENLHPVWVWNSFNHLDPNRHPLQFPDWTHANGVVYSPDDGALVLSMRHQNWVVKIDYSDGAGSGNILWHLDAFGDFALQGGSAPADWFYAQHNPTFFGSSTAGVLSVAVMDNGNGRPGTIPANCGGSGQMACSYSSVPVYQLDEGAKTATLTSHDVLPSTEFSAWGGSVDLLPNGNIEFDLCGQGLNSHIAEVTPGPNSKTVWSMTTTSNIYRAYRIPSLYPGIQW